MPVNNTASFWRRAFSVVLDLLFLNLVILWPFQDIVLRYFGSASLKGSGMLSEISLPPKLYLVLFLISALMLLYFSFFDYYMGQTPGMMLMRIETISVTGELNMFNAILRNCFVMPFFPFYIFWIIDPLYLAFYKERLLERMTNTKTISVDGSLRFQQFNLKKV
jgi:uncharacterized RDD family membrane protein YckC